MAIYNPNKAVEGIVDYKRKWDNAKATGKDTSEFEKGAVAYYKELRDNGRSDIADYLQKSDSVTAGEYLKQLQPEYGVDAASLQKKSDNLYGVGVGAMDDISKTFDKVYDNNINVNPTSTGYGKNILSGYGIAANEAYKGTLGGNAENNGGNVDSYAAANANRQKAAILSQGYGDVLGYYNAIAGQANQHAVNKGNTVGAYLAQLQGNINSDRDVLKTAFNGTVDLWNTQDTNKTNKEIADTEAAAQRYASDSDVKAAEISAKYGVDAAKITAEAEKYGWDTQRIMNSETLTSNEKTAAAELAYKVTKGASSGGGSGNTSYDGDSIVEGIIKKHTSDKYVDTGNIDENGNSVFDSINSTDWSLARSDLQSIINDSTQPYEQRLAVYNSARLKGINVSAPKQPVSEQPKSEDSGNKYTDDIPPEPIVSGRTLSLIDGEIKNRTTTRDKVDYLYTITNNLGLSDGNIVWLLNRYNIDIG